MTTTIADCLSKIHGFAENAKLSGYVTFKIGGIADYVVKPNDIEELQQVAQCVSKFAAPYVILGGGSNVLVSDEGFRGVVIIPSMKDISIEGTNIRVGAGVGLQKFLQEMQKKGLSGLEHLTGIPGSVGGAITGNAGTSKDWTNKTLKQIETVDMKTGKHHVRNEDYAEFEYRDSKFKKGDSEIVAYGIFELSKDDPKEINKKMLELLHKRKKQPAGSACAGCIFRNPKELPAGMLVEQLGLKGKKIGGAQISHDHGNFIVNTGNATARDIITLISLIKQQARDKRGIQLQEEIKYIGF